MPARIPIQHKSPFAIDPRPLEETASSHAGLLATARAFRSLHLPDLIAANLTLKRRQRGFSESQFIETLLLLQTVGGDCPEDIQLLTGDACLERGLGFALPKVSARRTFLNRFHDPVLAAQRPPRAEQKRFIVPSRLAITTCQVPAFVSRHSSSMMRPVVGSRLASFSLQRPPIIMALAGS